MKKTNVIRWAGVALALLLLAGYPLRWLLNKPEEVEAGLLVSFLNHADGWAGWSWWLLETGIFWGGMACALWMIAYKASSDRHHPKWMDDSDWGA